VVVLATGVGITTAGVVGITMAAGVSTTGFQLGSKKRAYVDKEYNLVFK